jgi:sepiapterin reductase
LAKATPNFVIKTLNYAPGPMDTAMQTSIREHCKDEGIKEYYKSLKEKNTLVDPNVSARKLMTLISKNEFSSGAHIDFYDP